MFIVEVTSAVKSTVGASNIDAQSSMKKIKAEGATGPNVINLPIIEDFQLPLRFQRKRLDIKEIEYINVSCNFTTYRDQSSLQFL